MDDLSQFHELRQYLLRSPFIPVALFLAIFGLLAVAILIFYAYSGARLRTSPDRFGKTVRQEIHKLS